MSVPLTLTFWQWSWTFKFLHTLYVKCEYFMDLKKITLQNAKHFVEERMEIVQQKNIC
jgi:hypothetical protein